MTENNTQEMMNHLRGLQQNGCGSFHWALIDLWFLASPDNKESLEKAFPDTFTVSEDYKVNSEDKPVEKFLDWLSESYEHE